MSILQANLALFSITALWILRLRHGSSLGQRDLLGLVPAILLAHDFVFLRALVDLYFQEGWRSAMLIFQLMGIVVTYLMTFRYTLLVRQVQLHLQTELGDLASGSKNLIKTDLLKPLLFPCRTSHTRMFPKKHSFSYSYLFVGIPIGWRGSAGTLLSADMESLPWNGWGRWRAWFSVESADYLERGDSVHGLRGKLDSYLETQVRRLLSC